MGNPEDEIVLKARAHTAAIKQEELTARREGLQSRLFGPRPESNPVDPQRSENPLGDEIGRASCRERV